MTQVTLLSGALWGIIGAAVMVIIMQFVGGDDPPPFAVFWSTFISDEPPAATMPQSLLLHMIYAIVAGSVYVVIFTAIDFGYPITGLTGGLLWGVVWGAILFVGAAVVWVNGILQMEPDRPQIAVMAFAHLGYGVTLGILSAVVPHLL